ncbi:MAG: hypothetical protein SGARI_000241 [Bacillariaceae sp.]
MKSRGHKIELPTIVHVCPMLANLMHRGQSLRRNDPLGTVYPAHMIAAWLEENGVVNTRNDGTWSKYLWANPFLMHALGFIERNKKRHLSKRLPFTVCAFSPSNDAYWLFFQDYLKDGVIPQDRETFMKTPYIVTADGVIEFRPDGNGGYNGTLLKDVFGVYTDAENGFRLTQADMEGIGKKDLAYEFCSFAASQEQSNSLIAQNATTAGDGSDPFRLSHLDVDLWESNGYDRESVMEYFDVLETALESDNAVVDIRFPTSSQIYALLDEEVHTYLNGTANGEYAEDDLSRVRKKISQRLGQQFQEIISDYDSQASTSVPVLEQYQKLRNVYRSNNTNLNQLGSGIRGYGFAIASLTMVLACVFALWSYKQRLSPVVKASQPFFLILICLGVFVLASSIFPMAIDDGAASVEACDRACMSIPWLITMGWSILFAALYAKLRRVNLVIRNAMAFRSIKVSEKDVMPPFAVLFTSNLILMTVWTVLNPLVWIRIDTSSTDSYGACKVQDRDNASWKVIISFLAILNGAALIGANLEAYKARNVDTEFGESSYIGLIMGSFLQVVAVGMPLFFLVKENPTARFFLTSSMVFLMCISVLLLLFIPKWRTLRKRQNQSGTPPERLITSRVVTSQIASSQNRSDDETSTVLGGIRMSAQIRYNEAAWIERVKNLESALEEAGINPKPYFRQADIIGNDDEIMSVSATTSSRILAVPDHIHHKGRIAVESSMAPLSEAIRDDTNNESNHGDMNGSNPDLLLQAAPESRMESRIEQSKDGGADQA